LQLWRLLKHSDWVMHVPCRQKACPNPVLTLSNPGRSSQSDPPHHNFHIINRTSTQTKSATFIPPPPLQHATHAPSTLFTIPYPIFLFLLFLFFHANLCQPLKCLLPSPGTKTCQDILCMPHLIVTPPSDAASPGLPGASARS
jgi:hypothetical protein